MRRLEWVGLGGIIEIDRVTVTKHDVVRTGAAIDGLVEVVANRVVIGEALEVGGVALLHVIETKSRRAFTRGFRAGGILSAEVCRRRDAV